MNYELRYYIMHTVDCDVDEKQTTREIQAENDVEAIRTSNDVLKKEKSRLIIPWAPILYQGERKIATSDPSYLISIPNTSPCMNLYNRRRVCPFYKIDGILEKGAPRSHAWRLCHPSTGFMTKINI